MCPHRIALFQHEVALQVHESVAVAVVLLHDSYATCATHQLADQPLQTPE